MTYFSTSLPSYFTFDLEKLQAIARCLDTYVNQVWRWYVKPFVRYRVTYRQTNKQMIIDDANVDIENSYLNGNWFP